jgi:hypothetical protein
MIITKRASINPNSHGPRDKGKLMNPNIAFLTPAANYAKQKAQPVRAGLDSIRACKAA